MLWISFSKMVPIFLFNNDMACESNMVHMFICEIMENVFPKMIFDNIEKKCHNIVTYMPQTILIAQHSQI